MKNISKTYRFITLSLAFLLLFTSTGFSIDLHYCGGKVADVSIFGKANACNMMEEVNDSSNHCQVEQKNQQQDSFKQSKCCYNETLAVDITDELTNADNTTLSHAQLTFITAYFISSYHLFFSEEKETEYFNYSPPMISKDIQVLDQVFII